MDLIPAETPLAEELLQIKVGRVALPLVLDTEPKVEVPPQEDKDSIRASLRASTLDGLFATIFTTTTGGVLLSNLLVELQASPTQIGLLASIPMLANLLQPLGAYLSNRSRSRRWYNLLVYTLARLPWFGLVGGIAIAGLGYLSSEQLVLLTLAMVFSTSFIGALGSASWLSWLAALVPHRLRGRYFGFRNSVASLTSLIAIPIGGLIVSRWPGGTLQGYGLVLVLGIAAGFVSLAFQALMMDVDPQEQIHQLAVGKRRGKEVGEVEEGERAGEQGIGGAGETRRGQGVEEPSSIWQNGNFLRFLLYFAVWMFAVNLSAPFFNLYLLDNLALDVGLVTIYNSLSAGANLLMLLVWGRIADRMGNRFLLLLVGILVAVTPILWLGTGANALSLVLWLPLLHMLGGGTWAAIDLCNNNLQMGIAPMRHHANYFAIAAAIAGVSGALGTTAGGFLAETPRYGGILGVFALSSVLRLIALLPLVFVREGRSIRQTFKTWLPIPGGRLIPFAFRAVEPQTSAEQDSPEQDLPQAEEQG
ncbi:MAG: MFS transporter [Cyanobacteria bacterium Co-bin13]|nr:MFS transporter [Cyanobacteria bacterium Co-bin13]